MECNATLRFKLPEQREAFESAQRAYDYKFALSDFDEWLRRLDKHELPAGLVQGTLDVIREKFRQILNEREIDV